MTVPFVVSLVVDVVATVAVLACLAALAGQGRRLAAAVRRFADEARPNVEAIARGTERIGSR